MAKTPEEIEMKEPEKIETEGARSGKKRKQMTREWFNFQRMTDPEESPPNKGYTHMK
jgi:hypothetical protein